MKQAVFIADYRNNLSKNTRGPRCLFLYILARDLLQTLWYQIQQLYCILEYDTEKAGYFLLVKLNVNPILSLLVNPISLTKNQLFLF